MRRLMSLAVVAALALSLPVRAEEPISTEAWWAVASEDGVQRIHIECGATHFTPRQVVVRAYSPVELHIRSTSRSPGQAFVMNDPGANVRQSLGASPTKARFHAGPVMQAAMECVGAPQDVQLRNARRGLMIVLPEAAPDARATAHAARLPNCGANVTLWRARQPWADTGCSPL